jgi:transcription elongation factor GreA
MIRKRFTKPPLPKPVVAKIPFTRAAFEKIQAEERRLVAERAAVMQRLKTAREMGDLSENGAYQYAKFELSSINRQLRELHHQLAHGEIREKNVDDTTVSFGQMVVLETQTGTKKTTRTYTLVSKYEADPLQGKISDESPLGQAIIGKKVGDTVIVHAPAGEVTYTISKIT